MKYKEIEKLNKEDIKKKLSELKMELIKSKTASSKTSGAKTKQIKKIIARLHTFDTSKKEVLNKK